MRKEKQQKRLVTKAQYVRVIGKKSTFYSFGILLLLFGWIGLLFMASLLYGLFNLPNPTDVTFLLVGSIVVLLGAGSPSIILILFAISLLSEGQAIEPIAPITRHNTEMLPVEESLVRASTEPPIDQQAQLLRAAQGGQEATQEQLLRSAQE